MSDAPDTGFADRLGEDYKSNDFLSGIDSVDKAAKVIVDLRRQTSNALPIPGRDASEEDRTKFRTNALKHLPDLAAPEKEDDYGGMVKFKVGPEGEQVEHEFKGGDFEGLRKAAHTAGLSKTQFEAMAKAVASGPLAQSVQSTAELKAGWSDRFSHEGANFDTYKTGVKKAIIDLGAPQAWIEQVDKETLDPAVAQVLSRAATLMADGKTPTGGSKSTINVGGGGESKEQAQAELAELKKNPRWMADPKLFEKHMRLTNIAKGYQT